MILQMTSRKVIILSGIPCSGKSTWARKQNLPILSCDTIRDEIKEGKKYFFNRVNEDITWSLFYLYVSEMDTDFIIDNTNCKNSYIQKIINSLNPNYIWDVEIKKFDVPLWKAYYRNIIRYMKTGKFIPLQTIKNFKKNYEYMVH